MQGAQAQQQLAQQSALARMQEQLNAQQQLGSLSSGVRGQDLSVAGQQAAFNQAQAFANQQAQNQFSLAQAGFSQQANAANAGYANQFALQQGQFAQQANAANLQAGLAQRQMNDQAQQWGYGALADLGSHARDRELGQLAADKDRAQQDNQHQMDTVVQIGTHGISDENQKKEIKSATPSLKEFLNALDTGDYATVLADAAKGKNAKKNAADEVLVASTMGQTQGGFGGTQPYVVAAPAQPVVAAPENPWGRYGGDGAATGSPRSGPAAPVQGRPALSPSEALGQAWVTDANRLKAGGYQGKVVDPGLGTAAPSLYTGKVLDPGFTSSGANTDAGAPIAKGYTGNVLTPGAMSFDEQAAVANKKAAVDAAALEKMAAKLPEPYDSEYFTSPEDEDAFYASLGGLPKKKAVSDEEQKKGVKPASIRAFLGELGAHEYEYKNPGLPGAGPGRYVSPMAQELEKTAIGRSAVRDTPNGKMVDYAKLDGAMLAGLADVHHRLETLEKRKKAG
jgi:hypothetical protein